MFLLRPIGCHVLVYPAEMFANAAWQGVCPVIVPAVLAYHGETVQGEIYPVDHLLCPRPGSPMGTGVVGHFHPPWLMVPGTVLHDQLHVLILVVWTSGLLLFRRSLSFALADAVRGDLLDVGR